MEREMRYWRRRGHTENASLSVLFWQKIIISFYVVDIYYIYTSSQSHGICKEKNIFMIPYSSIQILKSLSFGAGFSKIKIFYFIFHGTIKLNTKRKQMLQVWNSIHCTPHSNTYNSMGWSFLSSNPLCIHCPLHIFVYSILFAILSILHVAIEWINESKPNNMYALATELVWPNRKCKIFAFNQTINR